MSRENDTPETNTTAPAPAAAIAVGARPLCPAQDLADEWSWRVVNTQNLTPEAIERRQEKMERDKYDYASTNDRGHMLYNRKRSTMLDEDNNVEKLQLQIKAFEFKIASDKLQIEMAKIVKERAAALKVLADSGFQVVEA